MVNSKINALSSGEEAKIANVALEESYTYQSLIVSCVHLQHMKAIGMVIWTLHYKIGQMLRRIGIEIFLFVATAKVSFVGHVYLLSVILL